MQDVQSLIENGIHVNNKKMKLKLKKIAELASNIDNESFEQLSTQEADELEGGNVRDFGCYINVSCPSSNAGCGKDKSVAEIVSQKLYGFNLLKYVIDKKIQRMQLLGTYGFVQFF